MNRTYLAHMLAMTVQWSFVTQNHSQSPGPTLMFTEQKLLFSWCPTHADYPLVSTLPTSHFNSHRTSEPVTECTDWLTALRLYVPLDKNRSFRRCSFQPISWPVLKVTFRLSQLALGWVTVFRRAYLLSMYASYQGHLSLLPFIV